MARDLSGTERLWLTAERLAPPFVNQLVLEDPDGSFASVDWDAALASTVAATPGANLVLKGVLGWTRWVQGPPPVVRRVSGQGWSGKHGGGAPFLATPLDPRRGPTVELLLVTGSPTRVVLRSHHAVMDGRGTTLFAHRLFAAARGESLSVLPPSALTDAQLAGELAASPETPATSDCPASLGEARSAPLATRWVRRDVPGARGRQLLARAAVALGRRVAPSRQSSVRIDVPVDLRRHRPELQATGNLTGLVRLPVGELLPGADPVDAVQSALLQALEKGTESAFCAMTDKVRWLPLWLMERGGRASAESALATGGFSTTATVSNLGRMDLAALSAPGFAPRVAFWIPPGSPGLPLFLTLCGGADGVTLCGAAPLGLADEGRLEILMDHLAAALTGQALEGDAD